MTLLWISFFLLGRQVELYFKSDVFEEFFLYVLIFKAMTQPVFTWLKSTMETPEQCVKSVQS